ncbi:glucosaminidase domain-containing protein [Neolewinella litorea]|uniref:Mannosyl-glycoprotein endo-beta-N-acetylglucosamidase-like domain-containing protein n=1 Tax=Neolewinella litorea TaxID=2562452 RepID=A0A4S4NEG1_9BACT|nr:glucosaminidase domain-containing protein [Neolewinella litorea]THH36491.1 hypothetical protein E4021_14585 [Neolewinella litorea]
MKVSLTRLLAFAGRHWLRLGLVACALVLLSQKQVNFNVRLGHPDYEAVPAATPAWPAEPTEEGEPPTYLTEDHPAPAARSEGFFARFNFFGGGAADLYEELTRQPEQEVADFVTRFRHVAEAEQEKFGIPASITLATGLLYSKGGRAAAARDFNNYFGLACAGDWQGPTARVAGECVRRYETAWTSFRDFSLLLSEGRFSRLREFGPRDYRRWAAGMQELGFNANDDLARQLQQTIDRYQLFRFD